MPRRKTMTEYIDIIRRLKNKQSIRSIQKETGIHRTIIRKINEKAIKYGWLDASAELPREEELEEKFEKTDRAIRPLDRFRERIEEWIGKEYSYVVIHRLIGREYECSEATVRRYIKRNFARIPKTVMVRPTVAGETMEVDFGYLGLAYDDVSGRLRKAWLFSGRLNHSRKAHREIVFDQKEETFFMCHVHAFEHFGGVTRKVVPDNLKAAVIRASFESPIVNRVYNKLAEHYGFLINPCLPYRPEHKGGVENDIKYVKKNFWPVFCEEQDELGREYPYARDIQGALDTWAKEIADKRVVGGVGRKPDEIFESEEKNALSPLPGTRWEPVTWGRAKVQENWRIQYRSAFYSVPYAYIGKQVDVCASLKAIHIFFEHKEIAVHSMAKYRWEYVRKSEHAPPAPEKYMSMTRASIVDQARRVGLFTGRVVTSILDHKTVDGLRPARAVLRLGKQYGRERLETAAKRAVVYDTPEYTSVKSILVNGLDLLPIDEPVEPTGQQMFAFARKKGYFNPDVSDSYRKEIVLQ
jgi:transposase